MQYKKNRSTTLISPDAALFFSFFCHPTPIDDSGPKISSIWKVENVVNNYYNYKKKKSIYSLKQFREAVKYG